MKPDNSIVTVTWRGAQTSKKVSETQRAISSQTETTSLILDDTESNAQNFSLEGVLSAWQFEDDLNEYLALLRATVTPKALKKPLYIELPNSSPDWSCWYTEQEFEGVQQV